ncbi:MAG: hypothetical protein IJQ36_00500 [Oscillospiraceae bacterium]|nr:hypothetical protein [Oscillospiraceae bacterium]
MKKRASAYQNLYPFPVELYGLFCYNALSKKWPQANPLLSQMQAATLHLEGGAAE